MSDLNSPPDRDNPLSRVEQELRSLPRIGAPPAFEADLQRRLQEDARTRSPRGTPRLIVVYGLPALMLLVLGIAGSLFLLPGELPPDPAPSMQDLVPQPDTRPAADGGGAARPQSPPAANTPERAEQGELPLSPDRPAAVPTPVDPSADIRRNLRTLAGVTDSSSTHTALQDSLRRARAGRDSLRRVR